MTADSVDDFGTDLAPSSLPTLDISYASSWYKNSTSTASDLVDKVAGQSVYLEYGAQLEKRCIKVKEAANPDFTVNSQLLTRRMELDFWTRNVIKQLIDD